jgi:hypothetical protein
MFPEINAFLKHLKFNTFLLFFAIFYLQSQGFPSFWHFRPPYILLRPPPPPAPPIQMHPRGHNFDGISLMFYC